MIKERLVLNWIYAKQHADFMLGLQVGLEDIWGILSLRQRFVKTNDFLLNLAIPFINIANLVTYLLTWGVMFSICLLCFPKFNARLLSGMTGYAEDEAMDDFLKDARAANHQKFVDRLMMSALLLMFSGVMVLCGLYLFLVEVILSIMGQEMYLADEQ